MALGFIALNFTGPGKGLKGLKLADEAADGLKYLDEMGDSTEDLATVYRSFDEAGNVNYVGITNNMERRAGEQLRERGIDIESIPGLTDLPRSDARSVEQALIKHHGLSKNGGTLTNKINSIAESNPIYEDAIRRGRELLGQADYSGF
ncbi:MAG: GIY-YIG nuclease family protein [Thermoleophilia bacterium]